MKEIVFVLCRSRLHGDRDFLSEGVLLREFLRPFEGFARVLRYLGNLLTEYKEKNAEMCGVDACYAILEYKTIE